MTAEQANLTRYRTTLDRRRFVLLMALLFPATLAGLAVLRLILNAIFP